MFVVTIPEVDLNHFSRRIRTALLDIEDAPCTYGCFQYYILVAKGDVFPRTSQSRGFLTKLVCI